METEKKIVKIETSIRFGIMLFGLIGNILTFAIYSRKAFAKNSINIYARALALFDSFIFLKFVNDAGLIFFDTDFSLEFALNCKATVYIAVGVLTIPAWILVAFSLDKMLSVLRYSRFKQMKKKSFQLGIVATIAVIHLMLYSPILIQVEIQTLKKSNKKKCSGSSVPYWNVLNVVNMIESIIVPFSILMVTSLVTLRAIIQSKRRLRLANRCSLVKRRCKRKHRDETMYALSSIVRNITLVFLRLPLIFIFFFNFTDSTVQSYFFQFTLILAYSSNCIAFLVNVATIKIFRNEVKNFFSKK
jgi:hypothetical protein